MPKSLRLLLTGALLAYGVVLVIVLLNPSPAAGSELVARFVSLGTRLDLPAALIEGARVEFMLNVVAFMPLSLLGSLLRPHVTLSAWTAAGFAGSLLVEMIQTLLPDRSATHSDIVANTLGAALGAMVAWIVLRSARQ